MQLRVTVLAPVCGAAAFPDFGGDVIASAEITQTFDMAVSYDALDTDGNCTSLTSPEFARRVRVKRAAVLWHITDAEMEE